MCGTSCGIDTTVEREAGREDLVDYGNERIRALCEQRGINWGSLSVTSESG